MKIGSKIKQAGAFSLIEVMCAVALLSTVVVALYAGISAGFVVIQAARENLRATQIIVEKLETIRLYNWDQINSTAPLYLHSFEESYDFDSGGGGFVYYGTVSLEDVPFTTSYSSEMKKITITLNWTSKNIPRTRKAITYYTKAGLQSYRL